MKTAETERVTYGEVTHLTRGQLALTRVTGSAADLAAALNQRRRELGLPATVDRRTIAHWRSGRRRPDEDNRRAMAGLWGECEAAGWDVPAGAPSTTTSSTAMVPITDGTDTGGGLLDRVRGWRRQRTLAGNQDADLCDLGQVELLELRRGLDAALEALSERERLLGSPAYGELRRRVLTALPEGTAVRVLVEPTLPPAPAGGALGELAAARTGLEDLATHIRERVATATASMRVRHLLALARLGHATDEALRDATALVAPAAILMSPTLTSVTNAFSAALRPYVAERARVVEALEGGGPLCTSIASTLAKIRHLEWPSDVYRDDPVGFCRDVLGFDPWSRQREILLAIRDHKRVTIRSGQKTGKSRILAAAALHHFCSYPNGRVLLSNSSGKQLEKINWLEVSQLARESGRCLACTLADPTGPRPCPHSQKIDGELLKSSLGGLKSGNRLIFGATAKDTEGIGGFSGANLLVIVDEASSLSEEMAQAFLGNVGAKAAKFVQAGNPLRQSGPFFDSFHRNAPRWHGVHVTALEAAAESVPGLVSQEQIDFIRDQDERGEKSPFYQIRVEGNFPTREERSVYALEDILAAQDPERYKSTVAEGRLVIGCDPAGASGLGDESCVSIVRGLKVLVQRTGRGWTADDHAEIILGLVRDHRQAGEKPLVAIDADGVGGAIAHRLEDDATIETVRVYLGQNPRSWVIFDQVGDEAHELLSKWLRHGAVFPISPKLEQELSVIEWCQVRRRRGDREIEVRSATRKKDIRATLHRSPDRLDSLRVFAYGAYVRGALRIPGAIEVEDEQPREPAEPVGVYAESDINATTFDPYAAMSAWGGRRRGVGS